MSASLETSKLKSEDEYGRKFDRFSANCLIKMGNF